MKIVRIQDIIGSEREVSGPGEILSRVNALPVSSLF